MSDERKPEGTDPIEAARKGLGLLFQAARLTLERIPTQKFEEAVRSGAEEVGRVIESVTGSIEEQLKKHDGRAQPPAASPTAPSAGTGSTPPEEHADVKDEKTSS
jgi:hypothetical protein